MSDSDHAQRLRGESSSAGWHPVAGQVVSGAQRLVDSRPTGPYQQEWCRAALHLGDLTALVTVRLRERSLSGR